MRSKYVVPAIIFGLVLLVYANSLHNGFVFDDHALIEDNPVIRQLDLDQIFASPYWYNRIQAGLYRPVTTLSYAINYSLGELSPFGYHAANVALHGANAVLVFMLAGHLGGSALVSTGIALLFALHPVQTEAVNGIVGRAELLAAFWVLLSLLLYARSRTEAGLNKMYLASLAASLLGMLSKESAVCSVGLVVAYDWIHIHWGRWPGGWRGFLKTGPPRYIPFVGLVGLVLFFRKQVLGSVLLTYTPDAVNNPLPHLPLYSRILTTLNATGVYLKLLIFPRVLSADYSYGGVQVVESAWDPALLLPALLLIVISVGVAYWFRTKRFQLGLFGILWFVVTFSLTSNWIIIIGTILGERLLYLPSVGFALFVGGSVAALDGSRKMFQQLARVSVVIVLLGYGYRTIIRNPEWLDDTTLFKGSLDTGHETAKAYSNLGVAYRRAGKTEEAVAAFQKVTRLQPDFPKGWKDLGRIYVEEDRLLEALMAYRKLAELDGYQGYREMGLLYEEMGDLGDAVAMFQNVLEENPEDGDTHYDLARIYQRRGMTSSAIKHYKEVLRVDSDHLAAIKLLGALYIQSGRDADALMLIGPARERWPGDANLLSLWNRVKGAKQPGSVR